MIIEGIHWLARLAGLIVSGVRVMARIQLSLMGNIGVVAAAAGIAVDATVPMWYVDLNEPIRTGPCAFRPLGCSHSWQPYRCGVPARAEQIEQYQQKSGHQHRIDGVRTATRRHGAI